MSGKLIVVKDTKREEIGACNLHRIIVDRLKKESPKNIKIVCIGTDRVTGDCLGPLVGDYLISRRGLDGIEVYGTLNSTVTAKNVQQISTDIEGDETFIIAIDASLGQFEHIGKVIYKDSSLKPGEGLGKKLKSVGDMSITGVVNVSSLNNMAIIQNTRLSVVMELSKIIGSEIAKAIRQYQKAIV